MGANLNGRTYSNYIDGYDMLDYVSGTGQGLTPTGLHLRQRRRRHRRSPLERLEGGLQGEPR